MSTFYLFSVPESAISVSRFAKMALARLSEGNKEAAKF